MIKHIFFATCAAILVSTTAVQAQDLKAKGILESASKKMNSLKTLKANFTLKLMSNGKVKDTKKGVFLMKGVKYHIILTSQEIICDGKTVWTYMKDAKEVQVSSYNPDEQTISPTKLFTNFYDKEYSYHYVGTENSAGRTYYVVELTPVSLSKQFSKVVLRIDSKDNTIGGGSITEKNGNQYKYEVSGYTANPLLADNQFNYDAKAHPGVEVVDLR